MQKAQSTDQDVDFREAAGAVRRSKWRILAFAAAAGAAAAVVAYYMTPIYQASTTIQIDSKQANVIPIQEVYGQDTSVISQFYRTQTEILLSRPMAERVIAKLNLSEYPEYSPYTDDEDWGAMLREGLRALKDRIAALLPARQEDAALFADDITFENYAREVAVYVYANNLAAELVPQTSLISIYFQSEDPVLAANVANAHAEAYIQSILDERGDVISNAASWMAQELGELQANLSASEEKLQAFREQEGLIDVEGLKSLPSREINELSNRLVEVRAELSRAQIAYNQIYQGRSFTLDDLSGVPAILADSGVQTLRANEAQAQEKVAELAKRYGPAHAKMVAAVSELNRATASLRNQQLAVAQSVKAKFEAARSQERELQQALDRAKVRYQEVGRKESELLAFQREVDTNRNLYDMFYNRMGEMTATGNLESVPARIVSPAVIPLSPVKPNKLAIPVAVFVLALLLGMAAAVLLNIFNYTVRSINDVEVKLGMPLLGMLPMLKARSHRGASLGGIYFKPDEPVFNEAMRTIRTGISLDCLDNPNRVILVTSPLPEEGKSTVALNLAVSFAKMEKVLLIDADMRRPSIGKEFGLPANKLGLADLIAGQAKFPQCVVRLKKENLDVMPSGVIPDNPLERLSAHKLKQILQALRLRYDRIIIDSPPILPVSDGVVLSTYADSVVFVVRSEVTTVRHAQEGLERMHRAKAVIAGVILNQIDLKKSGYGYYGYGGYGGYSGAHLVHPA